MGNIGSAHTLVEVNLSFKFEGNPSISKGVIERTRISFSDIQFIYGINRNDFITYKTLSLSIRRKIID